MRPHVYGWRGSLKIERTGPRSTMRAAYITITSSAVSATTPRSWVIMITAEPKSSWSRLSRARICACVVTSSAVVGSSAMIRSGLLSSATASASWRPILCTGFSDVMGSWKIIAISSPRIVRRRLDEALRRSSPRNSTSPVEVANFESLSPITVRHVTLLPDPDSPTMPSTWPGSTLKLTPSTAFTTPSSVLNSVRRSRTSRRGSLIARSLREANPWIDPRVEDVNHEREDDDGDRAEDDDALEHGQVEAPDRLERGPSEPGEPEDGLDEDRAPEQKADVHPDHRHDGEHRVPQHVLADHPVLGRALGASGPDEVHRQRVHHLGTHEADVRPCDDDRKREARQDHVVGPVPQAAAGGRLRDAEHLAVPGDRGPAELVADHVREHEPDPERGQRDADQHVDHRSPVEQRSRTQGREDAERDRDREHHDHRAEDERGRDRRSAQDLFVHRAARHERLAERPFDDEPLQELGVLNVERLVEPEEALDLLDALRCRRLAGSEPRRVRRDEEEDRVGDKCDRDEQDAGPEEASDQVSQHVVGRVIESGVEWKRAGEATASPALVLRPSPGLPYLVQIWVR